MDLTRVFRTSSTEIHAVSDVDLDISSGEFVGIYGVSGSGKTTLLNLLGLLDIPSSGKILLENKETSLFTKIEKANLRNSWFGYLHQSFGLLSDFTAFENVEMPLLNQKISSNERRTRVVEIMTDLGIKNKMDAFPSQLSGGEQQRGALARALVTNPKVILTDEPTGSLDTLTGRKIVNLLKEVAHMSDVHRTAVVMVTHDQSYQELFDRVYFMEDGKLSKEAF
jgi:putative ABC transport system ATP-binding protein